MKFLFAIFIALSVSLPINSNAGLIDNSLVTTWEYKPYNFSESYTTTVTSGVEYDYSWVSGTYVDIGDNYIDIRTPNSYNGLSEEVTWIFTTPDYNGITGVSASTNFEGWSDSFLSFTNNSVKIIIGDVAGGFVRFDVGQGFLRINVETSPSIVPEPENLAMLLAGLGLLGIGVRRSK